MRDPNLIDHLPVHSTDYIDDRVSLTLTLIFLVVVIYIVIRVWLSFRKDKRKRFK